MCIPNVHVFKKILQITNINQIIVFFSSSIKNELNIMPKINLDDLYSSRYILTFTCTYLNAESKKNVTLHILVNSNFKHKFHTNFNNNIRINMNNNFTYRNFLHIRDVCSF